MKAAEIPENENERLAALQDLCILDTPIQEGFERITRLAKSVFDVPIVAFSLIDSNRQWFKSIQGLSVCETSREVSFCSHTINQDEIFIINDTLKDNRFADNPLVSGEPKIRFYAGYPVHSRNHFKIGSLCIIDTKPREFTKDQLASLRDIVILIETEIEANKVFFEKLKLLEELNLVKKQSDIDGLTRLFNRKAVECILNDKMQNARENRCNFGVALIDIDDFKKINDQYGHCAGDEVLREVAKRLLIGYRESDIIGRWGGEEFLIIIDEARNNNLFQIAERARTIISAEPVVYNDQLIKVTITTGVSTYIWEKNMSSTELVTSADNKLYKGKSKGKNVVVTES